MTDDEKMLIALREYWFDLGDPSPSWPKSEFNRVSYSKWAVDEIILLLNTNLEWSPLRATEEFKSIMYDLSHRGTYFSEINQIFEIAYGAASDISDILTAMI